MAFIARYWRFQPSEIDLLEIDEFRWWFEEGMRRLKIERDG